MNTVEQDYKSILLADHEGPCLSLYQPVHRTFPDRQQDSIRFGNLVKELERSLSRQYSDAHIADLLRPFHALAGDASFWNHTRDGLAVFATAGMFRVYNLQRQMPELAIVADSFHTKPLMRLLQSSDRYHILGLSRHAARLFEGNRYVLDDITPVDGFPQQISDVIPAHEGEPERTKRAHGPAGPGSTTRHGTNVRQDADERDTRQFFKAVADTVAQRYSQPSGQPLLLAALPEHHHLFRQINGNPLLMGQAVDADPASLSLDDLRKRAWDIVQPTYLERLEGLVERFEASHSAGRGSVDLSAIGKAVVEGRIETLLLDAERMVPGRFDTSTGAIEFARLEEPGVDDVLDDLSEQTLRTGGEVIIVPPERMPSVTGLAAIFRF